MEADQALAAFHKINEKCMNCSKFGHKKSTECQSKIRNSKVEGAESGKTKSKKVPIKVRLSVSHVAKWVTINPSAPRLSQKTVPTSSWRRRTPFL